MEVCVMPTWLLALMLAAACYAAAWRCGVDSRNGRYWRAHTPSGDLAATRRALIRVVSDVRELEERRALLERPWEEEFPHWARDDRGWHLHGHVAPPPRRRTRSVTSQGWCPGLSTNSR
jgi:hypothetical protein